VFLVSVVVRGAVTAAVCRWGLCPRCVNPRGRRRRRRRSR